MAGDVFDNGTPGNRALEFYMEIDKKRPPVIKIPEAVLFYLSDSDEILLNCFHHQITYQSGKPERILDR